MSKLDKSKDQVLYGRPKVAVSHLYPALSTPTYVMCIYIVSKST